MKTINYYKLIISIPFALLACHPVFSQSALVSNNEENIIKTGTKSVESIQSQRNDSNTNDQAGSKEKENFFSVSSENKLTDVNDNNSSEDTGTNEGISSINHSAEENKLEVNIDAGKKKTQTFTIQNTGDWPLIWNISPEGSEKLLYRLYEKNRDPFKLKNTTGQETDAVMTSEVYNAKETLMKVTDSGNNNIISETFSTEENFFKQKQQIKLDNIKNELNDSHISESSDKVEQPKLLKISKTNKSDEISSLKENSTDVKSTVLTDKTKLFPDRDISHISIDGINPENQLQVFKQWFRFSDYGRPIFDPQTEVWEVSRDNGIHWQQILNINGEEYVTNAICFDPAFYLEYHVIKKRNSPYSKLTLLSEFVKQAERGPTVTPSSGIIPSQTTAEIEFEIDASSTESGTYIPRVVITSVNSFEKIAEIPIQCNVVEQSEEIVQNQLTKQTTGEQLPDKYELSQNYPNPFNPSTTIKYSILADGLVTLKVYDVLGNEVITLVNEGKQAGFYNVELNSVLLASGVYFYSLQAGDFVETKKMVLLK